MVTDPSQVHEVGTLAHITRLTQTPRGVPWWLSSDLATLKTDVAFGLYANPSGDVRLDIIALW